MYMIGKYLNIPIFLISLVMGLLFIFIWIPDKQEVLVYPTPNTATKVMYEDLVGNCYRYRSEEIDCPKDSSIKEIPIQY